MFKSFFIISLFICLSGCTAKGNMFTSFQKCLGTERSQALFILDRAFENFILHNYENHSVDSGIHLFLEDLEQDLSKTFLLDKDEVTKTMKVLHSSGFYQSFENDKGEVVWNGLYIQCLTKIKEREDILKYIDNKRTFGADSYIHYVSSMKAYESYQDPFVKMVLELEVFLDFLKHSPERVKMK